MAKAATKRTDAKKAKKGVSTNTEIEVDPQTATYLDADSVTALVNRLSRLEGHVRAVKRMVEERRCADEILFQTAAVKAALNRFSSVLLDHELRNCMNSCMEGGGEERLDRVAKVLTTMLRQS